MNTQKEKKCMHATHTHTHTHTREMLRIVVIFLYYNNNFLHFSLTEETTTFSRFPLSNNMYVTD